MIFYWKENIIYVELIYMILNKKNINKYKKKIKSISYLNKK